jgi:hypothetical protein
VVAYNFKSSIFEKLLFMTETRHAILIGINDYEVMPLEYCGNDVELVKECFAGYCRVGTENTFPIKSTYNEPVEDIWASFEKALQRIEHRFVQGKDSIFFFYSGHGVRKGNSTAILFKKHVVQLEDIFARFLKNKPRYIFILIDSCFSGVGIEDDFAKDAGDYHLAQEVAAATGYSIFCAAAGDKPAKEDDTLKNGRFSHLFAEVIRNKQNYKDDLLNLSTVFHEIDRAFKERPEFRQLPFSQSKGLSTYPIALLDEKKHAYYSNHYVDDVDNYNWDSVKSDIRAYVATSNDAINEFERLVREILRNSKKWGGATHTRIEISRNAVTLVDDSGKYFDLFNPPKDVKQKGGSITAGKFQRNFSYAFELNITNIGDFVHQRFQFAEQPEGPCKLSVTSLRQLIGLFKGNTIIIPKECKQFIIEVGQGQLDLSGVYIFLGALIQSSKISCVPIILKIPANDRLKDDIIRVLHTHKDNDGNLLIE